MKNSTIKYLIQLLTSSMLVCVITFTSEAHFGSKGPFGGTVSCSIVIADTLFVGTAEGGVYQSTQSTNSLLVGWKPIPVGLKSGKITAIAHTGFHAYAATADSGIFIFNGVDESNNKYWNKMNAGLTNLHVTSLVAMNATTLIAGTTTGIFVSTNSGATWVAKNGGLKYLNIEAIEKAGSRIFQSALNGGVFYSDNNGEIWNDFNDGNAELMQPITNAISYNALTDELMRFNSGGIYVTKNASSMYADNFALATTGLPDGIVVSAISNDGNNWYLSTNMGVYTSASTTIVWSTLNAGLPTMNVTSVVSFNGGLVCGTVNKGIFTAAFPFVSWTVMNANFNNLKTNAMYTNGISFVIAATENGVNISKDLAANYVTANKGLDDSLFVTDFAMTGTTLIAATSTNGIYISLDSGMNWAISNTGLASLNIQKLFCSNSNFYAMDVSNKIYHSATSTLNWSEIQLPIGAIPTSLAFFGNNVLLTTEGQGVFIKPIMGTTWTPYNMGLSNLNVTSVTSQGKKIYVGTDGSGVFVSDSTLSSMHWVTTAPMNTAIPFTELMNLNPLKIQAMATYAGYIWASYKGGLLASSDGGNTWIAGGTQSNLPSYTDVSKITFVTSRVFVTTENNGLYSNSLSEIPTVAVTPTGIFTSSSVNNSALKVSPNPSTGTFNLNTEGIYGNIIDIIIYDYAGSIKGQFDGSQRQFDVNYDPGMYVVLLKTDADGVYSQKIVIK
jgi:hypothetical protein